MEEELITCDLEFLSISVIAVLSILIIIAARKFLLKVLELLPSSKKGIHQQKTTVINIHNEVVELRRTTQQISKDWEKMVCIIKSIKDHQFTFKDNFKSEIDKVNEIVKMGLLKSSDEFTNTSQKFEEMIGLFWNDMNYLKETIQSRGEMLAEDFAECRPLRNNCSHMWTQTEHVIVARKKVRDGKTADNKIEEYESSKSQGIKKLLAEFQREARKNSLKVREEVVSHVEAILAQMGQDQETIKTTIQQAFATSSYQSQKNLEQFGSAGQDALQYVIEKTEKSNTLMKDKFQEFDKKLNMIFDGMHTTSFDVSTIKNTLDNIDTQLDDIFQRIELGSQKNVEHCEEVLGGLETATEVWKNNSNRLKEMSEMLSDITIGVEHLMNELNSKTGTSKGIVAAYSTLSKDSLVDAGSEQGEIELNMQIFIQLQNVVRMCTDKVTALNDRLENGTGEIKLSIENLLRQIRFMCDLVESLGERFKFLELETLKGKTSVDVSKSQGKELLGDVIDNVEKPGEKLETIIENVSSDYKVNGDTITKTTRKSKPVVRQRTPLISSPIKKGKTIYSNTSSNSYHKPQERNQSFHRK